MNTRLLIIEDEQLGVERLQKLLTSIDDSIDVVGTADSVSASVEWLKSHPAPDVILMDIELADGQSFDIFKQVEVASTVIFTTSYDEYALKAFKVNSIDYLLKPIKKDELKASLDKYKRMHGHFNNQHSQVNIDNLVKELQLQLQPADFRKRFLVKKGQKLVSIDIEDIHYFFTEERLNFFRTTDNKKFVVDYTLDELEKMLDPACFFRVSRSFIIAVKSVEQIHDYYNGRLSLQLKPGQDKEVIVARERVQDFKKWMGK